jgi:hypothetical protein
MLGGDVNLYPILLLVNYWEIRPSRIGTRLDELLRRGITQFATFVPWQAAESDISNQLARVLQAAADREMRVYLILSPEVGVHYPNSGFPKDLISKPENRAQHGQSGPVTTYFPPNSFHLPSLFAPDFQKRYYSFLSRMDGVLSDLARTQPNWVSRVTAVMTGSLWKYYRSPLASSSSPFGGIAGDYSAHAALAHHQRVDQFFSQSEFMDPSPAAANRWKTRSLEDINRRWFYQQAETQFRSRSVHTLRKKSTQLKVTEIELYTPEADTSLIYSHFLQWMAGGHIDFNKISVLLDEAASRASFSSSSVVPFWAHWTCMGGFRMLADAEKQFLILKSLLLAGGQGGGILVDETEWFSLSAAFRSRVEPIARSLVEKRLQLKARAFYWVPHLWSDYGTLWSELRGRLGPSARMISSLELIFRDDSSNLLIVDPSCILTREVIQKLLAWTKSGRVVVLPRTKLYTESARIELEQSLAQTRRMEIDLGFTYQLYGLGEGKLIIYDTLDSVSLRGEPLSAWQVFLNAILSVAEVESYCQISDPSLRVIPLDVEGDRLATFILNGSRRSVTADMVYSKEVQVGDLGQALVSESHSDLEQDEVAPGHRFTLDVPPFGVLPLVVEGFNMSAKREQHLASDLAQETRQSATKAAMLELPGLDLQGEGIGELWN